MKDRPADTLPPDAPDSPALEASGLGIRHRTEWVLRGCDLRVPRGRIAALVGPNGDGKSSLLALASGLRRPDEGTLRVLGGRPGSREVLPHVGVLLQDRPLHAAFTVAETLRLGRELNPRWDQALALAVLADTDVPLDAKVGRLSGGQRTCVALALVLAKRPALLLLDEPMADLDPLRRHTVTARLMATVAEHGTTVIMSSHSLAELDLICDYVLLLAHGRLLVADDTEFVQAAHTWVTHTLPDARAAGPGGPAASAHLRGHTVVESRTTGRQLSALLQLPTSRGDAQSAEPPTLEEILLAYLRNPQAPPLLAPAPTTPAPAPTAPADGGPPGAPRPGDRAGEA
ncbi:ABC transporter ATP-binding protein [Streptomyces liangshanensis]|uniref:ABC transporter ATP-binding protein n=1 Tax=Streptomyces liangshanensis TaxID=2717324 RepID=UPI0036DBC90D